jgi:parallel beta-helix repeat protein
MSKRLVYLFHRLVPAVLLVTLLLAMAPWGAVPHAIAAGDWYVNPGESIQAAIDAADAAGGGTVHVAAGTYHELITLNNNVVVQGAGATVTTINGDTDSDGDGEGSVVTALNVNSAAGLDGFTITNGTDSGGMLNSSSSPTVTNCTFSGNLFSGMFNKVSSGPTVTNCTFSGNLGHGMVNDEMCDPTVTNCTFSGNEADEGGGMFNGDSSHPTVTNCAFSGNGSDTWRWDDSKGGGMYNANSSPTLTDCTFSGNRAAYGNGIYNHDSSPTLTNCTFSGNHALVGGGMYNNSSSPTLTNCTFSGNYVDEGSGGGMYNNNSSTMVTNCTFSENGAGEGLGGGMCNINSSTIMSNCIFSGNCAGLSGGGIYGGSSSSTITNCTFSGNFAWDGFNDGDGGGIYGSPTLANCTFSGNWAWVDGGAICGSPTLTNCTFSGNRAITFDEGGHGGGIYGSPTLANCILWGDSPDEIYGGSANVSYSDIDMKDPSASPYAGTGNINADPLLTADFHLQPGSPCIDAGSNSAPSLPATDFEGDDRILDGDNDGTATVDMGADEAAPNYTAPKVTVLALPFAVVDTAFPVLVIVKNHADSSIDKVMYTITVPKDCTLVLPEENEIKPYFGIPANGYSFAMWFVECAVEGDLEICVNVVGKIGASTVTGSDCVEITVYDI